MATRPKKVERARWRDDHNVGKVVRSSARARRGVEPEHLPRSTMPCDRPRAVNGAASIRLTAEVQRTSAQPGARRRHDVDDGVVRGMEVVDTGKPITVPVGQAALGASSTCWASRWTKAIPSRRRRALADPPREAEVRRPGAQDGGVRDGDQGHRPDRPVREGRQDRPVRRRRVGRPSSSRS